MKTSQDISASPVLFMLASTFSLSLTGLMSKLLTDSIAPSALSFLRFAVPALLIGLMISRSSWTLPRGQVRKALWVRALCIAACQICFIYALSHLSLVESVVLFGTGPLFIPVLEKLIFRTAIGAIALWGLTLTFVGVVLLAGEWGALTFKPALLVGLLAGLFNAGSQLSLYRVSHSSMSSLAINLWTFVFAALLVAPYLIWQAVTSAPLVSPLTGYSLHWGWGLLALLIVLMSLLIINTQVFRAKAYRLAASGSQLAPLIFTNLIFSTLWQWAFYDEHYHLWQWIGLSIIVLANVMVVLAPHWQNKKPKLLWNR